QDIPALDVPDEVESLHQAEHRVDLEDKLVAFGVLFTVREEADGGVVDADDGIGIDLAHHCELEHVDRLGVGHSAEVDQHRMDAFAVRNAGRDRRSIDSGDATEHHDGRSPHGAAVAGRQHGVGLAVLHEPHGDVHGCV